ncbi:class I SAM-dependent methyltransferase [Miniimonas arenae]|uniref:class I SAM-dependent methyltransferase n=1 Tax=Miniimonas arenae TaxID=676201 RepID=UPI0035E44A9A
MNGGPPDGDVGLPALGAAGYEDSPAGAGAAGVARTWWDANADEYQAEHGDALGDADFVWGPEGLREADAHLLGDLDDLARSRVLEVGAGAAQCSRWLRGRGVDVVATDLSGGMLATGRALDTATGVAVPLVQADARALPFANASFDVVFTSYGVIPFVPDARTVHREVARVLRPGGRWVFSTSHPVRWAFPDDPGPDGLVATRSYFDARAYVERAEDGSPLYAEFHRTLATHVADVVACGFVVDALTEPEWSPGRGTWGGWSALRGAVLPGTLVLGCRLAG